MTEMMTWRQTESIRGGSSPRVQQIGASTGAAQQAVVLTELAGVRLGKAIRHDSLATGIHPRDHTKQRASAVYERALEYLPEILEATVHVQRDAGIEFMFRTAKGSAVVTIEPTAEPEFEVTLYENGAEGTDAAFDSAAKAIAHLAARIR